MTATPRKSAQARIAEELKGLLSEGEELRNYVRDKDPAEVLPFAARYHTWYTGGLAVVKALVPERLDEFRRLYERNERRKQLDAVSYAIEDYVHGLRPPDDVRTGKPPFDFKTVAFIRVNSQREIINACLPRLTDILADIRGVLQADLFDSELDAARNLLKNGHVRAAGAVAGVVLEGHLAEVCASHVVVIRKKDPHINDYNNALKDADVLDVAQWRRIQHLGDIRNLCDHKKQRDPKPEEVADLLDEVDKAIKTLR